MNNQNTISTSLGKPSDQLTTDKNQKPGYRAVPFSMNRRMVAASASAGRRQNNIHALIEVDITEPRRLIREHRQRTGEKLSLTAYVITCLAQAIAEHPHLNAFRRGNKLILLDDVTIGTLVERELSGELVPESFGIRAAQTKTYHQIQAEIREAQHQEDKQLGGLSGFNWTRFIPEFMLPIFFRLASRSITVMKQFGAVAVTAVGMFGNECLSLIPLVGGATVGVAVGGIVDRLALIDGQVESREHLCLTVSFNHDIVDGAPAARFLKRFAELLESSILLRTAIQPLEETNPDCVK